MSAKIYKKIDEVIKKIQSGRCRILIDHSEYTIDRNTFRNVYLGFSLALDKNNFNYLPVERYKDAKFIRIHGHVYEFDKGFFLDYLIFYLDCLDTFSTFCNNSYFEGNYELCRYNKKAILNQMSCLQIKAVLESVGKVKIKVAAVEDNEGSGIIINGGNFKEIKVTLYKENAYKIIKDFPGFKKGEILSEIDYKSKVNLEKEYIDEYINIIPGKIINS